MEKTMKKTQILLIIGLTLVISESFLGFTFIYYGIMDRQVEGDRANAMLNYIKTNNPAYYENIMSEDDPSYRSEFYRHYMKKGNSLFKMGGLILVVIALNNVLPMMSVILLEKKEQIVSENEEESEEKAEEKEEKESEGDQNF